MNINRDFLHDYETKVIGGFEEPLYVAKPGSGISEIRFTRTNSRSLCHEMAHWFVAGSERRKIDDYGYWYEADGRNQAKQLEFFQVEIKPQAIEAEICVVLGLGFEVSADSLNRHTSGIEVFAQAVERQRHVYRKKGFPKRAQIFLQYLRTLDFDLASPGC